MRGWLLVNVFFVVVLAAAGALLWGLGFTMWSFGLAPDDNPVILSLGLLAVLVGLYLAVRWLYQWIEKRV